MNKLITILLFCIFPLSASFAGDDAGQYVAQSKMVVEEFSTSLKGELGKAMKAGGPANAIEVCNKVAPDIARKLSEKHGMKVARTSLKTRNSANAPDDWEKAVLEKFEERRAEGENSAEMAYYEIVKSDGKKEFRFMKAINMPPLSKMPCLKCHGENIAPEVSAKLDELYPDDRARGYKAGQIRGAFSLAQPLD